MDMKSTTAFVSGLLLVAAIMFFAGRVYQNIIYLESKSNTSAPRLRDYQLDLHIDTVRVYDGDRFVGSYISNWQNQIDTILLEDNQ